MTTIPDAAIESAARIRWQRHGHDFDSDEQPLNRTRQVARDSYLANARAELTAALPHLTPVSQDDEDVPEALASLVFEHLDAIGYYDRTGSTERFMQGLQLVRAILSSGLVVPSCEVERRERVAGERMRDDIARWVEDARISGSGKPAFLHGHYIAGSIRCGGYESDAASAHRFPARLLTSQNAGQTVRLSDGRQLTMVNAREQVRVWYETASSDKDGSIVLAPDEVVKLVAESDA